MSLQVAPALAFQNGRHPSAGEVLTLLRQDFWRLLRAGVVVSLATQVIAQRVFCHHEPAWPAVIASVKEVGNGPAGAGLVKWELIAGLLMLASIVFCGVPLLITVPLGNIVIQQYLASSGLGLSRQPLSDGGGSGR